ncbi:CPBP family intramembrane glutamic endopeptidase [Aliikangiella sp. IMCC44359]|uniref:CPBP family intramembrane glutamic endopeptidase n=1 Tax=Aliikangiella sp. IMCC44359 TaxID=3459125 RepID=UPI00403AE7ED
MTDNLVNQVTLVNLPDNRLIFAGVLLLIAVLSKYFHRELAVKGIKIPLWGLSLTALVIYCFAVGFLKIIAVISLIVLFASIMLANSAQSKILRSFAYVAAVLIFLSLGLHVIPDFQNQLIVKQVAIKSLSQPFSMYINFDKSLAGVIVFLVLIKKSPIPLSSELFIKAVLISLAMVGIALGTALSLDIVDVNLDYLLGAPFLIIFIVNQIMIVCLAEEVFFRGMIQEKLYSIFDQEKRYYYIIPVSVTAIIFGIVHLAGGVYYMLVAMIAGLGYGLVYQLTRRVEFSIACHFLLNIIHLGFLSYPIK